MDILRPVLININGRIYRKNTVKEDHYEEEEEDFLCSGTVTDQDMDETCDSSNIEQTDKGFRCAIDVPSVLYKYIIGKKGETRKRLESETKTSINIPKPGVEGQIVITGPQKSAVASAVTRVEVLVENFRRKQPFTHFLSFALNHPQVQEGFQHFKEEVLEHCSQDLGVDESIFQNPAKLHLTVGTIALLNEQEVMRACELLQQCQSFIRDITEGKPLSLAVKGIEYMNDDPTMVDVLYAKVIPQDGSDKKVRSRNFQEELKAAFSRLPEWILRKIKRHFGKDEQLQELADRLVECFVAAGLMVKEWDRVKLHATVMNTLFRKDPWVEDKGGPGRQNKDREAFDSRKILEMFGEFYFGSLKLDSVQLSQRFSSDCTGYYCSAGHVTFS